MVILMEVATVTSKSMLTIPARIRRRYGIKEGMKVAFVESEAGIMMIPVPSISELFGIGRDHRDILLQAVRELEQEHRSEAQE